MNRKQSVIFFFSLGILLLVFAGLFTSWIIDDVKNSPPIEAEMANQLPDKSALGITSASQVAGSATAASQANSPYSQQPPVSTSPPTNTSDPSADGSSQVDTTSEKTPLADGSTAPVDQSITTDKKTFTSDSLGISFDYTTDLKISKGTNSLTIANGSVSWKMKFYDDKKKEDIETWFKDNYKTSDNPNCTYADGVIKAGSLVSKLVKSGSDSGKCDDAGNFLAKADNSQIVKVEQGKETTDNINKVLTNFKFN